MVVEHIFVGTIIRGGIVASVFCVLGSSAIVYPERNIDIVSVAFGILYCCSYPDKLGRVLCRECKGGAPFNRPIMLEYHRMSRPSAGFSSGIDLNLVATEVSCVAVG